MNLHDLEARIRLPEKLPKSAAVRLRESTIVIICVSDVLELPISIILLPISVLQIEKRLRNSNADIALRNPIFTTVAVEFSLV